MSFTLPIGSQAPEFDLPGSDGSNHTFAGVKGRRGTLVFFTCNHCPYVVGSEERMQALYGRCAEAGIAMVAIHANETKDHPDDNFEAVKERMRTRGFGWLSLHDGRQLAARAYGAERTPHFFLFDAQGRLAYSGRMDNSPRDAGKAETHELDEAIQAMLAGKPAPVPRTEPIGCNIKWWDKEAHWMPAEACDLDYLYTRKA